ncbi:MMPL family transporter [bacterium]|nr:MMPL family transporter [bacterium]
MNWARRIVRARLPLLLLFFGITISLVPSALRVDYNRSIASFFDLGHPLLSRYEQIEREFGGDSVCVVVYDDEKLLSPEGLARLGSLRDSLKSLKGVSAATSLANLRRPSKPVDPTELAEWFKKPNVDQKQLVREILETYIYSNQFVGKDGRTAAIMVIIDPKAMQAGKTKDLIAAMRQIVAEPPYAGQLVGAPVLINDFFQKIEEDAWTLTTVSVGTMGLVILLLFRNIRWMLLPLLVVLAGWVWLRAGSYLLGLQLGFTASLTTALISVIGIATTIHIAVRFREELELGFAREEALERSFLKVMPAVFWTCVTTAIGFGSLMISSVAPVRDFGIAMASVSMLVGLACVMLLPGGILIGRASSTPMAAPGEETLTRGLADVEQLVTKYSWASSSLAIITIVLAGLGLFWLKPETDFTKNFRSGSPVLAGYRFAEDRLGGAGLLGLSFDTPKKITREFLSQVRLLEDRLRELPGVTKVIGLTDFLDFAKGQSSSPLLMDNLVLSMIQKQMPGEIGQVWNTAENRLRIILRVQEQLASDKKEELIASIEKLGKELFGDSAHPSGLYVLLVFLMDSLLSDQWSSFLISSIGAIISLSIAFGSLRLGIVAFIPNLIPIVTVVGFMGWVGLRINAATAMIQSISMGLAVDFSIHYIYRLLSEVRAGHSFSTSLLRTHRSTGKAMVFASLALMLGFGVLVFSNFLPTMQFGLLVSLAMVGGLIGNLVLLPVLLEWFAPKRFRVSPPAPPV